MCEANILERQVSLTSHCNYNPTNFLHPIHQVTLILPALSVSFCCKYIWQNKASKSQTLIFTTVIYSHKCTRQPQFGWQSWALWGSSVAHSWAGLGWSRLLILPGAGGYSGHFSHGHCRGSPQQVETQCLLLTKFRTGISSIGQSKSQGQTQN